MPRGYKSLPRAKPLSRNATGCFIGIEREGRWQTVDIGDCTDTELAMFFSGYSAHELLPWTLKLASLLRERITRENV